MNEKEIYINLKELISKGYNEKATNVLLTHIEKEDYPMQIRDKALLISNRLHSVSQRERLGLKTSENQKNEIVYSLIQLINSLESNSKNDLLNYELYKEIEAPILEEKRRKLTIQLSYGGGTILVISILFLLGVNTVILIILVILSIVLSIYISQLIGLD